MFLALGRRRVLGRGLPPVHPRLLQGPALPRLRLGDPRHGRRAGHALHGRAEEQDPDHALDHVRSARVAIAGIPGLAGFFSKDEILWQAYSSPHGSTAAVRGRPHHRRDDRLLHVAADEHDVLRQVAREARSAAHIHESPASMTGAADACWRSAACWPAGWARRSCGISASSFRAFELLARAGLRLGARTRPSHEGGHDPATEWMLMGLSVAIAIIGIAVARYFYHHKPEIPDAIGEVAQAAARPSLQQVVRGRDLRFPVRQRPGQEAAACCWAPSTATWWTAASTARAG